jgi:tetratricopeptide (TPR) repeat protein
MNPLLILTLLLSPAGERPAGCDRAEAYYHFSLGLQARFSGETEEALVEYRRAQKLDTESGEIHMELARLLRESGKFDEAIEEATAAVSLDPDSPESHLTLGQLYQMQAETGGDAESWRKAAGELEKVSRL